MANEVIGSLVELRHKKSLFYGIIETLTPDYWEKGIDGYHIKWKVHINAEIKNKDGSIGVEHCDFVRILCRDEFVIL